MEKEREAVGTNLSSTTTSTKRAEKRLRKKKEKDILSKDKDNDRDISEGPREGRCAFFVERKKMFCRLSPLAGKSYCFEHLALVDGERKVVCPFDPAHTVLESRAEYHMRKCAKQSALKPNEEYVEHDFNTGTDDEGRPDKTPTALEAAQEAIDRYLKGRREGDLSMPTFSKTKEEKGHTVPRSRLPVDDADLATFLERIMRICDKYEIKEPQRVINQESVSVINSASTGAKAVKHQQQHVELIALLRHLVHSVQEEPLRTMWCEMGSGKGKLSQQLYEELDESSHHLLVDRDAFKGTHVVYTDEKMEGRSGDKSNIDQSGRRAKGSWQRVQADIRHLNLAKVDSLRQLPNNHCLCIFGKHLCGAATDLTIRSMAHFVRDSSHRGASCVVIALCCHHKCDWRTYSNKAFFEEEGLNGDDFTLLTRVSSWAICGGVSEERVAIGRQCKRLIDYGRLQVLQKDGYDVRLAQYTSREVTPENIVLIASRTKRVDTPL